MIVALAFSPFSDFVWQHGPTFFIDKRSILTMPFCHVVTGLEGDEWKGSDGGSQLCHFRCWGSSCSAQAGFQGSGAIVL